MKKNFYLLLVMLFAGVTSMFAQKVYIEDFTISAGETKTLDIILESEAFDGKAVSADFVLPEGLTTVNTEKNKIIVFSVDAMMKSSSIRANGSVGMAIVSATVEDGAKVIGTMDVVAAEDYAGGEITVTNQSIAGTKVEDVYVKADLPIIVSPELGEWALSSHSLVSVDRASQLAVYVENCIPMGATFSINEMNMGQDEEGTFWTVGAEVAVGELSMNTVGFFEFEEELFFVQGKKYQLSVTLFENPMDPTEIGTYTFEFNGSYVEPIVDNIVISEAGYATYWAPFTVDLNYTRSNVEAYIVTGINEDNTIATELIEDGIIPAFQPVLLKGDAGVIPMSGEEEDYADPKGILEPVLEDGTANIGNYVLQNQEGGLGFYQVTEELQPEVKAYRATLVVPNDKQKVKAFFFSEATAISEVASATSNAAIYDLSGRKVAKAQNGVFVVNGKKVIK